MSHAGPYTLTPLPLFGAEVHGIDLNQPIPEETIERIKADVTEWVSCRRPAAARAPPHPAPPPPRHCLLLFRGQGIVSGARHVEISCWFGAPESTFYKHPASPHPDIFRVSNDPDQGCTGVGRTGWHVDGSFQAAPFSHSLYHIVAAPSRGATAFVPLHRLFAALPPAQRARWERLSMASDRRGGAVKPLVYTHPRSQRDTLCVHTGMTAAFLWDAGTPGERLTGAAETVQLLDEVGMAFTATAPAVGLVYAHAWRSGDFIITDNAAVGHEASPDTQLGVAEVGLRVLHRTTVGGRVPPAKGYAIDAQGRRVA